MRTDATEPMQTLAPDGERRSVVLEVLSGPRAGTRVEVTERPLSVGAGEGNALVLEDPAVSRQHLQIAREGGGAWVRDLASSNGTFLSGARAREFFVEAEATFSIGRTLLCLKVNAVGTPIELSSFGELVSKSPRLRRVFSLLVPVAAGEAAVLLQGETGTGKEQVARTIHLRSRRAAGPFVVLDCAAVAAETIESELFGHVKGAFTGAIADRVGALASAEGGTLFLDEVGELPLELQPRLLRFLETGSLKPVGGSAYSRHDVRVVSATHRDLRQRVAEQAFRADLFFRLAVVQVDLPPLRERLEDLETLVRSFVLERGRPDFPFSAALLAQLHAQQWPGNVRELKNFVDRALVGIADEPQAEPTREARPFREAKEAVVEALAREYFGSLLQRTGRNVSEVARLSGVARPYLHELIKKYGL